VQTGGDAAIIILFPPFFPFEALIKLRNIAHPIKALRQGLFRKIPLPTGNFILSGKGAEAPVAGC
jgi:hypothetical protein